MNCLFVTLSKNYDFTIDKHAVIISKLFVSTLKSFSSGLIVEICHWASD